MSKFLKVVVIGLLVVSSQSYAIFDPTSKSEFTKKWIECSGGTLRGLDDQYDGFYVWVRALADGLGIKISIFLYNVRWPTGRSMSIADGCLTCIDEACEDSAVIFIPKWFFHRSLLFNKDREISNIIQNDLTAMRLYQLACKTVKLTVKSS